MRSLFPERLFSTYEPASSLPEYALKKAKRPTNGSVAILNAKAENGSLTEGFLDISSLLFGFVPTIASLSSGEGKYLQTASRRN